MSQLALKIVTPEQEIFNDQVNEVYLTTPDGEIGILPYHTNLMTQVVPGELRIKKDNKHILMATGSGLAQMANNVLTITTDLAEKAEDIDEKAVEEAHKRAKEALEQTLSEVEYADTIAIIERATAQLKVKRRFRTRI